MVWAGSNRSSSSQRWAVAQCFDETVSRLRSHGSQGLLRFADALDDLAATARRCPSPGERQHPVLTPGDDGLAQKDFDSRRANRRALDRVPHVILGRWVPSQTASWFKLRDRLVAAADAVVDVTAVDRACPTRQMRPDRARNPVFDL